MKNIALILLIFCAFFYVEAQTFSVKKLSSSIVNTHLDRRKYQTEYNRYVNLAYPAIKLLPKNYNMSGNTDFTIYIQKALNNHNVVLLPNFPIQISDKGLKLNSNQILLFQPKSKLVLKPTAKGFYSMLAVHNINNVKIFFANLEGDRYNHLDSKGQWGFGIDVKSANDVEIISPLLKYMWGDGIYIGQTNNVPSAKIVVRNAVIDDVRRNGISITSADRVDIIDSYIANTNGNSPESGLDIEPNSINDEIKNVNIRNLTTYNNKWSGLLLVFELFKSKQPKDISVNIDGHFDVGSRNAISFHGFKNDKVSDNLGGGIKLRNLKYEKNQKKYFFYKTNLSNLNLDTPDEQLKAEFNNLKKK